MIVIKIMERDMIVTTTARVTSGSVNLPVKFHFKGDEWDDLVKTAVFIGSGEERDVALITDECAVPADVLAEAGGDLKIGVYGRLANGATVIPTIWGRVQYIYEGTEMSEPSPHDPEPDWTAQVQQAAATALTKATAVEEAAARGDFDGVSPEVTIDSITHGHSVTITDREHPEGQSFDVLDGASAYEQAVAGGYEGTEAQFNAELAAFKELIAQITANETAIQGKQNKINGTGLLKGQGDGSVVPAEAGTDYLAPSALSPYRTAAAQNEIDQQQDAAIAGKYTLPAEGIPKPNLADPVQTSLDLADVTYEAATAAGSVVTFSAPGVLPLKSLVAKIEPVQAGSGDPSPNNVRAITGWTGANIVISPTQLAADGSTISVTFPAEAGTVYGGTLDLLNGVLTVDRIGKKIKDLSWTYETINTRFESIPSPAVKRAVQNNILAAGLMCECYKPEAASGMPNECIGVLTSQKVIIKDNRYTTVSAFTAAMGEYLVVYELSEPITYQIEQRAVATLLGTNNIWANTGDVSVTYGAYVEAANDHTDRVEARLPKEVKTTITLDTSWSGSSPTFTQTITVSGYTLTPRSKIDLQPDDTVILQLAADNVISLFVTNNNSTLTACAVGAAPTAALSIQCTIKEVDV